MVTPPTPRHTYTPTPVCQHFCKVSSAAVPHITASEDFLAPNQIRMIPLCVCVCDIHYHDDSHTHVKWKTLNKYSLSAEGLTAWSLLSACLQMSWPGQCHQFTWMGINSGLFPPRVLTQYYLYPVNASLTALGTQPDLFIFKVFTQEAGPRITFNAKYTSGHTKCRANLFLLQFMCSYFLCEGKLYLG